MAIHNLQITQLDPNKASDRSRLVKFVFKLYKNDPYWVAPLIGDRKKFLDPQKNPSFEYLKVAYFVNSGTEANERADELARDGMAPFKPKKRSRKPKPADD